MKLLHYAILIIIIVIKWITYVAEQSMGNMLNCTNETSFTNFSAITESTRITPKSENDTTVQDVDKTNEISNVSDDTILDYNNRSLTSHVYPLKIDKRGETSNWIKDLEDENNSIIGRPADLEPGKWVIFKKWNRWRTI